MADYYSLLAKAVANLPKASPASARKAIYDRARKALVRQLRSLGPALSEADIAREEAALEAAVARLEAQFAPAPSAPPAALASRPAEAPAHAPPLAATAKPNAPASPPVASATAPAHPPLPAAPAPAARPAATRPAFAPAAGAAVRPSIGAEAPARPIAGARPAPPPPRFQPPPFAHRPEAIHEPSSAPPIVAASEEEIDVEGQAPRIDAASGVDRVAHAPAAADHESIRPIAPSRLDAPRANPWPWFFLAVVVGLVISVAVAAFLLRQKPQDLAIKEPVEASDSKSAASAAKIVERVGGGATATPAPASPAEPSPTPTPAGPPAAAPAPVANSPAAATSAQSATTQGLPVSARAAMLVAVASDQQKPPAVSLGSVVWTAIPPIAGQPATVGVKAEADIPDLKMHAIMTIRKNGDPSLPASHTIDLRVTFGDGAEIKGIKDMRVPSMRRDDPPGQDPLAGVRVKISDSYFLVGLNRTDADVARNADLIASRAWFDFPMLLNDDRIAKLTFEKGADGERILSAALAAWKAP
ncbi:MAG TPA: hypothetical protein VEF36_01425 [Roseiarcus sp.]|nr:hypothetical protein [Roseiarcus sp.]